jgi:hypothetical protein
MEFLDFHDPNSNQDKERIRADRNTTGDAAGVGGNQGEIQIQVLRRIDKAST